MEINKIQVPVSGQPADDILRRYALYFAHRLGASLLGTRAGGSRPSGKVGEAINGVHDPSFRTFNADCRHQGIAYETRVAAGSWQSILSDSIPFDLTVLPCGKRNRLPGLSLEDFISDSPHPVFLCPDHYIEIESIALAYDGGASAKSALALAVWLSEKAAWPLSVLMVADDQEQAVQWMDEVEGYLDALPINGASIILSGAVEHALLGFMKEGSVELLMMGSDGVCHARHPGSIGRCIAYMIEKTDFPLLMVS
jgi:nucleotide-binding universal stress UspA family protein